MGDYSRKFAKKLKPFLNDRVFTVSEFINFVNGLLEPLKICKITVKGEIGEDIYVNDQKGWAIFSVIDKEGSKISCFSLSFVIDKLAVDLEPGLEVKISGYPEVRKDKGRFSFRVNRISLVGEGDLKKQFEILKKKLDEDGYFDPKRKKEIPVFPEKIGLITSKGSDAEKDFFTHLTDYGLRVSVCNSKVEGGSAIDDLVSGIEILNKNFPDLELIVITRGGGSWESLQAFNSEEIVKAAFSSKIPVISAIGHENDLTLLDLVADQRVSTPTDAGKFLSKSWEDAEKLILNSEKSLSSSIRRMIVETEKRFVEYATFFERKIKRNFSAKERELSYLFNSLTDKIKYRINRFQSLVEKFKSCDYKIFNLIKNEKEKFQNLGELFKKEARRWQNKADLKFKEEKRQLSSQGYRINQKIVKNEENMEKLSRSLQTNQARWKNIIKNKLSEEEKKIKLSSPTLKLKQGYSITKFKGKPVKSIQSVSENDLLETTLKDGNIKSRVKKNE